jgi:hypothetical protein
MKIHEYPNETPLQLKNGWEERDTHYARFSQANSPFTKIP